MIDYPVYAPSLPVTKSGGREASSQPRDAFCAREVVRSARLRPADDSKAMDMRSLREVRDFALCSTLRRWCDRICRQCKDAQVSIPSFGWELLGTRKGRSIIQGVCALMARNLERKHGPATLVSRRGVVRLWRLGRFAAFSSKNSSWLLDDGVFVQPDDPVLEMHIAGDRLMGILLAGERWRDLFQHEFASLVPALE